MANKVFDNIISAIKAIRAIPMGSISLEPDETGRVYVHRQAMGLKEAKDLTEAIMALGVRRYLADELARLNREANLSATGQRFAHVGQPSDDIRF